ncbi:MAG: DUF3224 domain-containing protein [Anaerolineae bacterium]|nr:DUF3224 domain-containing protein [Anaerolineae bacterium]
MTATARASFAVKSWTETTWDGKPAQEVTGAKLTRAQVNYTYQGDLDGESTVEYLMNYNADGSGQFVALERFTGTFAGRSGSVVFQQIGTFEPVRATLTILPGSGTGELAGLRGSSTNELAGHQPDYPITFEYRFE